jgi:hypothetical protein
MARQSVIPQKKKRGPKPTGKGTPIMVRLQPDPLAGVDRWASSQEDSPSRPEAIRRLVDLGLASAQRAGTRAKASEMAGQEIDRLGDPSATDEERQLRKRRLIKGPNEFRDIRSKRTKG